jgi:hypothetical protein
MAAASIIIEFTRARYITKTRIIAANAKNQTPCLSLRKRSIKSGSFFSKNNQWKYRKSRNTPPNMRIRGFCSSMASAAMVLCPVNARKRSGPLIFGTEIHTMISGRMKRTKNTDVIMPISRNRLRHSILIVLRTLALTMALSTLFTTSKTINPATMSISSTRDNA